MNVAKRRLLMNPLLLPQFNYCSLMWMFHSCGLNNKINCLNERSLLTVCSDNRSSFEDLSDKDESVSIHVKNVQTLDLKMFKEAKNLSAPIVRKIFEKGNNSNEIMLTSMCFFYIIASISHLGPQI